jgi:hypothetical protein
LHFTMDKVTTMLNHLEKNRTHDKINEMCE